MIFAMGLPAPCPAFVSTRIKTGLAASLGGLEGGGEFEAVRRHHPVVVIGGGDQRRGIRRALLEIMQRGIRQQGREILRVVRRAKFRSPRPADGELVETQHVQDADFRDGGAE